MADDWFASNAPQSAGGQDWFSQNKPPVSQPEAESLLKSIFLAPARGLTEDIPAGFRQMMQPGLDPKLGGASRMFHGAMAAAAPFMLPEALIAAPGLTAASLAGGALGGAAGQIGANIAGAPPGMASAIGDVGSIIGGGLPYAGKVTGITPRVSAGVKGAASAVKAEAPQIGKWSTAGTGIGGLIGWGLDHPAIGAEVGGGVAGTARTVPPAVRGFMEGFTAPNISDALANSSKAFEGGNPGALRKQMKFRGGLAEPTQVYTPRAVGRRIDFAAPEMPGSTVPETPRALEQSSQAFDESKRGALQKQFRKFRGGAEQPMSSSTPRAVGRRVNLTPPEMPPPPGGPSAPPAPPAASAPPPGVDPTAWGQLTPEIRDAIYRGAAARKGATPSAPAPTIQAKSTFESPLPQSEQQRILQVAEQHRTAKNLGMAQYFTKKGISANDIAKMPDAEYDSHVKAAGYQPSTGKNYSRDKALARQHVIDVLKKTRENLSSPPMPPE